MITKPVYIVDIVGQLAQATQTEVLATIQANETAALGRTSIQNINYQYGHFRELMQTLAQWDTDPNLRMQKYPLIYLVQDFKESRGKAAGVYADVSLNIIICHQTEADYKAMDRMAKVFKTVLYPIYYSLLKQISKHSLTFAASPDLIPHDKTDRLYWGANSISSDKTGGTDRTMLNDFVDAIDIQNLQVKIDYQPCF